MSKKLSSKDYKKVMAGLYKRLEPLLKKSESEVKATIEELQKKVAADNPKIKKIYASFSMMYDAVFKLSVDIVKLYLDNTNFKQRKKLGIDLQSAAAGSAMRTSSASSRVAAKLNIPPELLKLHSLCMNLQSRLSGLKRAFGKFLKTKDLGDIKLDKYKSDWSVLANLLALQDVCTLIGIYKTNKKAGKKFIESRKSMIKMLMDFCIKSKEQMIKELKKMGEIQEKVHKKLKDTQPKPQQEAVVFLKETVGLTESEITYLQEGILTPFKKIISWMFDSAYYFFKKLQPIFLFIKKYYDKILGALTSAVIKPLYAVNPMMGTIAETFLSPVILPMTVKVTGMFFGGAPAIIASNISWVMGGISTLISLGTMDIKAVGMIDSAVNLARTFADQFSAVANEMQTAFEGIEDELDLDNI